MEEKNIREIRTTDKSDGMEREGMEFSNFETEEESILGTKRRIDETNLREWEKGGEKGG